MSTSVTYRATLSFDRSTVEYPSRLLAAERRRRRTRKKTRLLTPFRQAVLVLRWFVDGTRVAQLALDNALSKRTCYRYLHEGIDVLKARAPSLEQALAAAKAAGHGHLLLDGTLIETDACHVPGPTPGVDLWWSGKHKQHGGNIQVISAPDGFPIWASPVRPGREHDTSCARAHGLIDTLSAAAGNGGPLTITDTGYEGAPAGFRMPYKKPKGGELTLDQKQFNKVIGAIRAMAEKANAGLKTRFKALRHVSLDPWRIGAVVSAALTLFHFEKGRTA